MSTCFQSFVKNMHKGWKKEMYFLKSNTVVHVFKGELLCWTEKNVFFLQKPGVASMDGA